MNLMAWGDSPASRLFYRSREHQTLQFQAVAKHLPATPQHLLDVGCGYGDFIPYLPSGYTYEGIDTNPHVIESAQHLYPEHSFRCTDEITDADVIVSKIGRAHV